MGTCDGEARNIARCINDGDASSPPLRRESSVLRRLGPLTANGIRHSTLTLASTALGGGVLSVAYVLNLCGFVLGTILIALGGFLAFFSTQLLMRMSSETGRDTYAGLFSHCAGRFAGPVLDAMLFIYGNGSCTGYLVFIADFYMDLIPLIPNVPAWITSAGRALPIVCAACIVAPMSLLRDVSVLKHVTYVSIITLVYVTMVVAVKSPSEYNSHSEDPSGPPTDLLKLIPHVLEGLAICIFAFNCHINVVPVAGKLVRPTRTRILKVSAYVNVVQVCFYTLIGVTGYLSFMKLTKQDILKNYAPDDTAMVVARIFLTCTMLVAIPVNLIPTVRSGLQIVDFFRGTAPDSLLAGSPESSPGGRPDPSRQAQTPSRSKSVLRVAITLVSVLVQAVIGIQVPGVADIMGLLGATVATAMMLAIPAYCMGKIMTLSVPMRMAQVTMYVVALLSLLSVPVKILHLCGYDV